LNSTTFEATTHHLAELCPNGRQTFPYRITSGLPVIQTRCISQNSLCVLYAIPA
jgi:hypothetical protein